MEKVLAYIDAHRDEYVEMLQRFCRQPSVSATGEGIPEMMELVREELRKTYGPAAFAILLKEEISEKLEKNNVCLDGLYSWSELLVLREALGDRLTVVAIIAERKKRYGRIAQRAIRPLTPEQAESRDIAEIEKMEKGGPIAMADLFLFNDGSEEEFRSATRALLDRAEAGRL